MIVKLENDQGAHSHEIVMVLKNNDDIQYGS